MRIANLVENESGDTGCESAHGLSFYVETENHKAKVSSAWVHKSPKTNDSWFGDLVEWILTK